MFAEGSDFVSKPLEVGYTDTMPQIFARGVVMEKSTYKPTVATADLLKEKINQFTFYYNPKEITIDLATRKFLENFRTDDGEDCFTLTRDEEGLVIY